MDRLVSNLFFVLYLAMFLVIPVQASDIASAYGQTIKLASGYEQLIKESPATVSVITKEDIKRIGAITIEEVLETIPGIHVSYANGFLPTYVIRGIGSSTNSPVLIYLDGIPINSSVVSTSHFSLSHLAKNVEKIEIIKGTGSALYGADAFSGVINIITKKGESDDIGTFAGSNDDYGGWFNFGQHVGDFKINFSAQGRTTNGSKGAIESDRQSQIDRALNTNASLAPGSINRGHDEIDLKLETRYQDKASIYLRYIKNTDYGMGVGIANSLDNSGTTESDAWVTGLKYNFGPEQWKSSFDINYTGYVLDLKYNVFPTGAFGGLFNTPVINKISYTAHDFSTDLATIYTGLDDHKVHVGVGFEYDAINDISDERNFIQGPFNTLLPTGSLQSTQQLGVLPIADSQSRYNYHGFIQDEWRVHNDVTLTTGVRADYFSDFDLSVNPRASLIWKASPSLTTKLMYGMAFRAPSFFELYTNPGVTVTGNKNLKPETIQTLEWSIHKRWAYDFSTQLNLFWYETDDLITETIIQDTVTHSESRIFNNAGGANTYGLEFEFKYQIIEDLDLNINYAYLNINSKGVSNDQFIVTAPTHQVYAAINWSFLPNWSANLRSNSIIGRKRANADTRHSISDYTKLDFTLKNKQILGSVDLTFKIDNLLDSNIREPSIDEIVPGDYPLDSRTFMGIVSMKF